MCNCHYQSKISNPLKKFIRALHCDTRWQIIRFIGHKSKSTKEIYDFILKNGENLSMSSLYYHLSELKSAEIIEVVSYKEEGGGAPEKIWKLKKKKIEIDLLAEDENYNEITNGKRGE